MSDENRSYDPAEASHLALRGIVRELRRHPAISTARGFPAGEFSQVVATVSADRVAADGEAPTLTVRWFAGSSPEARPEFSFHYSDDSRDFGWHHEPNPHVDGWGHFQERTAGANYSYDAYEFASTNPTRVVWEVLDVLTAKLQ